MSIDPNQPAPASSPPPPPAPQRVPAVPVREYRAMNRVGWQAFGLISVGVLFVFMLLIRWTLMLLSTSPSSPASDGRTSGILGGLAVIPIFMLVRGVWLLRSVVRVVVDPQGVWVEGFFSRNWVPWQDVHSIRREKKDQLLGDSVELLTLLDARGKVIARLPDTLGYFSDLARDVAERSAAAQGRQTADADADAARQEKSAVKKLRLGAWLGGVLTLMFGAIFVIGLNETLHVRRYATEGVRTEAKILSLHRVRQTPQIKYEFKDGTGRVFERETSMELIYWAVAEMKPTVTIEYLPSDPDWNRLVAGETKGSNLGRGYMLLSGLLMLLVGALTVFAALGYDLDTDGGKMRVTRHGRPLGEQPPPRR